mmetsp:Transcript_24319/g.72175  ORF Transcript_24319/g.72175 Transcript_24319/m.72175 type:complete len:274 (+) Transcript_24319:461-1282(+)
MVLGVDLVRDGPRAHNWHAHNVAARVGDRALGSDRDLAASLAANAHQAVPIADNRSAAEAHELATLNNLGHAVELQDALLPVLRVVLVVVRHVIVVLGLGQLRGKLLGKVALHVGHLLELVGKHVGRQLTVHDHLLGRRLALRLGRQELLGRRNVLVEDGQLLLVRHVILAKVLKRRQRAQLRLDVLHLVVGLLLSRDQQGVHRLQVEGLLRWNLNISCGHELGDLRVVGQLRLSLHVHSFILRRKQLLDLVNAHVAVVLGGGRQGRHIGVQV